MERITYWDAGKWRMRIMDVEYSGKDVDRIASVENIFGDNYDLTRLRHLVEADRDGRCVVVPAGGYTDKDGENALKSAMNTVFYHNNPVTRYIADAVAEKLTREAAEAALEKSTDM